MRLGSEWEEPGEERSDQVFTGEGISEVKAEEAYIIFLDNLIAGQKLNIPYRAIRSRRNDPKWMTNKLKYIIGLKRNKYKKVKAGQDNYREQYIELSRSFKKLTHIAKRQYEIKIAS